ncbi:MAG: hypothetical protein ACREJ3_14855, partial [Polyangiaceae bacterium]
IGPPPSLPGKDPPAQCDDIAGAGTECPPDFPGCAKKKAAGDDCEKDTECDSGKCSDGACVDKKAGGEDCSADNECSSGTCSSGKCAGKKAEGEDCDSDDDCDSGRCKEGSCAEGATSGKGKPSKIWIGVGFQADMTLIPGANDVCSLTTGTVNPQGYGCVQPGASVSFPDNIPGGASYYKNVIIGRGDQVKGGFKSPSNMRLFLSLDYALGKNSLLGLRVGYVLNTAPAKAAFAPLHIEARYTYVVGRDALTKQGISPMVLASLGAGEFDAYVPITVYLNGPKGVLSGPVNAWLTAGPVFAAVGGGARMLLGPKTALTADLKFQAAFGGAAGFLPGLAPEVGVQLGF